MPQQNGSTSRFVQWAHSSDSSSGSDDSKSTRANTVEITNLDSNTTHARLLVPLMIAGPFGKVYSINIKMTEANGKLGATALVAFFKKESCHHLEAYANVQGILVMGRLIKVSQSKEKAPETIEPQGRDDSRVLLFEGKNHLLTQDNLLKMLAQHKIRESHIQTKELLWKTATISKVVVAFTSYHDAYRMFKAVHKSYDPDDLRVSYGRDPMETGVKTYVDTAQSTPDGHQLKVRINW